MVQRCIALSVVEYNLNKMVRRESFNIVPFTFIESKYIRILFSIPNYCPHAAIQYDFVLNCHAQWTLVKRYCCDQRKVLLYPDYPYTVDSVTLVFNDTVGIRKVSIYPDLLSLFSNG